MSAPVNKTTNIATGKCKTTNTSRNAAGSNWQTAQHTNIKAVSKNVSSVNTNAENHAPGNCINTTAANKTLSKSAKWRKNRQNRYVAIDCEMVGIGAQGQDDMLARVSVVNKQGDILIDKYVKPTASVVDYRTNVSGIRPQDIENGDEFDQVQNEVISLLQGKILVGHGVRNDLTVLRIKHPYTLIRDTSRYKPLSQLISNGRTPSLKHLSQAILGIKIQTGEHNSVEDARAAMRIYNRIGSDWEKYIASKRRRQDSRATTGF